MNDPPEPAAKDPTVTLALDGTPAIPAAVPFPAAFPFPAPPPTTVHKNLLLA